MFDESKHPRDEIGRFTEADGTPAERARLQEVGITKKMTSAEKIASVHIEFGKDNILPELNEDDLEKIGTDKNRPVLLKKEVIDRNRTEHPDVSGDDMRKIIGAALYRPNEIFIANPEKPNYYHYASFVELSEKGRAKMGMTLLDIDARKECFEIVHMHYVGLQGLQRAIKKTIKNKA